VASTGRSRRLPQTRSQDPHPLHRIAAGNNRVSITLLRSSPQRVSRGTAAKSTHVNLCAELHRLRYSSARRRGHREHARDVHEPPRQARGRAAACPAAARNAGSVASSTVTSIRSRARTSARTRSRSGASSCPAKFAGQPTKLDFCDSSGRMRGMTEQILEQGPRRACDHPLRPCPGAGGLAVARDTSSREDLLVRDHQPQICGNRSRLGRSSRRLLGAGSRRGGVTHWPTAPLC